MNKKLVLSIGMLAFAGAAVVGGTGAFFSSTTSSTGNVFTAGSVTLALDGYTHQYLVDGQVTSDPQTTPVYFQSPAPGGSVSSFALNDLKPLDNGIISANLENGANDAFVCARITGFTEESPFRDMLAFRTGTGPGGSFGDIVDAVPLDTWFAPVPPSTPAPALAMNANQGLPISLQYCFGEFQQGGGCEINPLVDYNPAQGQTLTVDVEYYAVQQRNNEDFSCANLNAFVGTQENGWPTVAFDDVDTVAFQAEGRIGNADSGSNQTWEVGVGINTGSANSANDQYTWQNGVAVPFTINYDGTDAVFTVDGVSTTYTVGPITAAEDLFFVARGNAGFSGVVTLSNLQVGGNPTGPSTVSSTDGPVSLRIDGDFSGGFTASGDVTMAWTGSPTNSAMAFQVQLAQ